jgi:hypothetical protein
MATIKLKEAIKVLSHGGFIREPNNNWSTHAVLYNRFGFEYGQVTTDCYYEITETLGYANCEFGLLKSGHRDEYAGNHDVWGFCTINGDFKYVDQSKPRPSLAVHLMQELAQNPINQ